MGESALIVAVVVVVVAGLAGWAIGYSNTQTRQTALASREAKLTHATTLFEAKRERELKEMEDQQERKLAELEARRTQQEQELNDRADIRQAAIREELRRIEMLTSSFDAGYVNGREWLANAVAEVIDLRLSEIDCWLACKPNPAWAAAKTVREVRVTHRHTVERLKLLEYQLASYEEYFPFLSEYREAILDEAVDLRKDAVEELEEADPALSRGYLAREEFDRLSQTEKFQLALDRYWKAKKSSWEIGRVYERMVGYRYENDGWKVDYHGIRTGFADFGRDLICRRDSLAHIVQCKCWSADKLIREKHIFQLFGTTTLFRIHHPDTTVVPVFTATCPLSEDAQAVADRLDIDVRHTPLERYPMIKCNINLDTGEKIYHLPFDQQYDRVIVGNVTGEFFASTVKDAEEQGFRRAWRWKSIEGSA